MAQAPGAAESAPAPIQYVESEYLVETWQTEQGLPDNFVNDIAQTPDGYLWVATFNGLARFNGHEFIVFDAANTPELRSNGIRHLYLDRKGRLWIKGDHGQLSQWAKGRFTSFADQLPKEGISPLTEDHAGDIWASSSWDTRTIFSWWMEFSNRSAAAKHFSSGLAIQRIRRVTGGGSAATLCSLFARRRAKRWFRV